MSSKRKRAYNPYKRYCCVYGCLNKRRNNESTLTFFKIPEDIERRQEWLTAIDREDLLDEKLNKAKRNFVCSAHFNDSAIITSISKRLKSDAFPTKLLPHKSHKNIQPNAPDSIATTKDAFTQTLPQTSKDLSSHLSTKDNILISTDSHTQSKTNTQAQQHTLSYEIESEIAKPNIDKSLNEHKSTAPPEPTTSTSQSQTKVRISPSKITNIKEPEVTSTSTQADLNEHTYKITQTTPASSDKSLRKRKLKKERNC